MTALLYVVMLAVVAALLFLLSAAVFGRGEELEAPPRGSSAPPLPPGEVTGEQVRALRFTLAWRGYSQAEVDRALARLAAEVDRLRAGGSESTDTGADTAADAAAESDGEAGRGRL